MHPLPLHKAPHEEETDRALSSRARPAAVAGERAGDPLEIAALKGITGTSRSVYRPTAAAVAVEIAVTASALSMDQRRNGTAHGRRRWTHRISTE